MGDWCGIRRSLRIVIHFVEDEVWGKTVQFGALHLDLAIGSPDDEAIVGPKMFRFARPSITFRERSSQVPAWLEAGHTPGYIPA
jgi:hypothetical protein